MIGNFWTLYVAALTGNLFVRLLAIAIMADMIFGSLRAAREKRWNSAVGINGGIRKCGMVAAAMLLTLFDMILPLNLIGWISESAREALAAAGILKMGITELFCFLFILYELTSILKNMCLCGLPIPRFIREKVEAWLAEMTDETHAFDNKIYSVSEIPPDPYAQLLQDMESPE